MPIQMEGLRKRPEFLQRLRTLAEGLPIAAQLKWDLSEAEESTHTPPTTALTARSVPLRPGASP